MGWSFYDSQGALKCLDTLAYVADAKGDICIASGANAWDNLTAGADGLVPMYDDAATLGVAARRIAVPDDLGLFRAAGSAAVSCNMSPRVATDSVAHADGYILFEGIYIPYDVTLTGAWFIQAVQGSYTADNNNKLGLYTLSGGTMTNVAATVNDGDMYKNAAGSYCQYAFSSTYAATAGLYYVASLWNNSANVTSPSLRGISLTGGASNTLGSAVGLSYFKTGQTDLGASVSSLTATTGGCYLLGVY